MILDILASVLGGFAGAAAWFIFDDSNSPSALAALASVRRATSASSDDAEEDAEAQLLAEAMKASFVVSGLVCGFFNVWFALASDHKLFSFAGLPIISFAVNCSFAGLYAGQREAHRRSNSTSSNGLANAIERGKAEYEARLQKHKGPPFVVMSPLPTLLDPKTCHRRGVSAHTLSEMRACAGMATMKPWNSKKNPICKQPNSTWHDTLFHCPENADALQPFRKNVLDGFVEAQNESNKDRRIVVLDIVSAVNLRDPGLVRDFLHGSDEKETTASSSSSKWTKNCDGIDDDQQAQQEAKVEDLANAKSRLPPSLSFFRNSPYHFGVCIRCGSDSSHAVLTGPEMTPSGFPCRRCQRPFFCGADCEDRAWWHRECADCVPVNTFAPRNKKKD